MVDTHEQYEFKNTKASSFRKETGLLGRVAVGSIY